MRVIQIVTLVSIVVSLIASREKTLEGVKYGLNKLLEFLPIFLTLVVSVSFINALVPDEVILKYVGGKLCWSSVLIAGFFGSITLMPGFIAYPIAGVLLQKGVGYTVIASFVTTLMLVGVLTFPMERKYFGTKVAVIRNIIGLIIAGIITLVVAIVYGEL